MKILLNDILKIQSLSNVKIRFNKSNNADFDPIKLFKYDKQALLNGHFHNYNKRKSYREGDISIGFARISKDKWLLFDISKITKDLNIYNGVGYEYETIDCYEKYFGRLIIEFQNKSQNLIRNSNSVINDCIVHQILEDTFDNDIFPGYDNVNISWKDLDRLIRKSNWKTALENQKGVYLITDNSNGKMYIGAAYGTNMILGRWQSYIYNGHGNNKELIQLQFEHIKNNFNYSILDIYKSTVDDNIILKRESWWKRTLLSVRFGYNHK
ncbi:GIY-YIG nuclease family protein [Chryseobacterium scophthalmum]|uniref:GIY-YIG nuclease family protein n=1 Tax=Chryseobacterium scophthalmum TaxID=59733 RepID=UPI003CFBC80A